LPVTVWRQSPPAAFIWYLTRLEVATFRLQEAFSHFFEEVDVMEDWIDTLRDSGMDGEDATRRSWNKAMNHRGFVRGFGALSSGFENSSGVELAPISLASDATLTTYDALGHELTVTTPAPASQSSTQTTT